MTEQLKKLLNDVDQVLFDAGEEISKGTRAALHDRIVALREGALHDMLYRLNNDDVVLVAP